MYIHLIEIHLIGKVDGAVYPLVRGTTDCKSWQNFRYISKGYNWLHKLMELFIHLLEIQLIVKVDWAVDPFIRDTPDC